MDTQKIELEIDRLSQSLTQMQSYAVVLSEVEGRRRLPVVIGAAEAQSIAMSMEKMSPSRPLTHDLMKNVLQEFGIELKEVIINNLLDGVFYAQLVCKTNNTLHYIDSRTSDALALAVRFRCPIYTYESILESAGITLEGQGMAEEARPTAGSNPRSSIDESRLESLSEDRLQELLEKYLNEEAYEQAARVRDELHRRKEDS